MINNFSDKIYNKLKKGMPQISETERVAIESGNTWIESDIFQGKIDDKKFKEIKLSELSEKEQSFINNELKGLFKIIDSKKIRVHKDLDEAVWNYLKDNRFFGMIIPEEFGGLGFSAYANSTIVAMIAAQDINVAVTVMVPNSLGPGELLMKYGTDKQKERWLKDLAEGREIPCFALTSPVAGSDAGAIPDIGIVEKREIDGKEVIGLNINFNKRYITLAPKATLLGLAFKMQDPNNILGEKIDYGITCALLPMDTKGVDNSNRHHPMNLSFMNGPLFGKDVFVPLDAIIGGADNAGKGWKMLVECLSAGRGISLPALSTAMTQSMYKGTSAYSSLRKQFGTSIVNFEGVEEAMIEIAGLNYITESLRHFTTTSLDMGNHPAIVTAITKYHATEMGRQALQHSMDIHAGKAIMAGEYNYHIDAYLGMPIAITVEGANILTRNLMIFGQGSMRCHPFILKEMELLYSEDEVAAKEEFKEVLKEHIKYTAKNGVKSFINNLTLNIFESSFGGKKLKKEKKMINALSKKLSFISDVSLLYLGGKLKKSEILSSRLGDVLSYLYMALAVIKKYEESNCETELKFAKWSLYYLFNKASKSFDEFLDNFPNKAIALSLRLSMFTFGVKIKKLNHYDSKDLINETYSNMEFRNKLTNLVDVHKNHPMYNVEKAFDLKMKLKESSDEAESIKITKEMNEFIDLAISVNHTKK